MNANCASRPDPDPGPSPGLFCVAPSGLPELGEQFAEGARLEREIGGKLRGLGYEG